MFIVENKSFIHLTPSRQVSHTSQITDYINDESDYTLLGLTDERHEACLLTFNGNELPIEMLKELIVSGSMACIIGKGDVRNDTRQLRQQLENVGMVVLDEVEKPKTVQLETLLMLRGGGVD